MKTLHLTSTILFAGAAGAAFARDTQDTRDTQAGGASFCTAAYMPAPRGAEGVAGEKNASPFAERDTNGDGMVDRAEYLACRNAATGTQSWRPTSAPRTWPRPTPTPTSS